MQDITILYLSVHAPHLSFNHMAITTIKRMHEQRKPGVPPPPPPPPLMPGYEASMCIARCQLSFYLQLSLFVILLSLFPENSIVLFSWASCACIHVAQKIHRSCPQTIHGLTTAHAQLPCVGLNGVHYHNNIIVLESKHVDCVKVIAKRIIIWTQALHDVHVPIYLWCLSYFRNAIITLITYLCTSGIILIPGHAFDLYGYLGTRPYTINLKAPEAVIVLNIPYFLRCINFVAFKD